MAIEETEKPHELIRLDTLIECADRRSRRAQQRLERAEREAAEAEGDLARTRADRRQWLENNPPAQFELII